MSEWELDPRTYIGPNAKDEQNEQDVINKFCEWANCEYFKFHDHERVDYALYRKGPDGKKKIVALAEVKCRYNHDFYKYGDLVLSLHKRAHCIMYADAAGGVPVYLLSRHNEGIFYVEMREEISDCRMIRDPRMRNGSDETVGVIWKGDCIKKLKT